MKTFVVSLATILALTFIGLSFNHSALSQEAKDGKTIFVDSKCIACHGVSAAGVEAKKKSDKVPDLSKLTDGKDIEFWTKYMKKDETLNDKKHAVPFKGSDEDLKTMIEWLMSDKATN
jgi:mono/diheme cytochrome c family protein